MERLCFGIHFLFHHNACVTKLIDEYCNDVKSVCRIIQLRDCSETLCRSTPKQKAFRKIQNGTVFSFLLLLIVKTEVAENTGTKTN